MGPFDLRPLNWSDLPALVALANRGLLHEPEGMPLTQGRLRTELSAPGVRLADDGRGVEAGGQLVAWAALWSDTPRRTSRRGFVRGPWLDDAAQPGTAEALIRWTMRRAGQIGVRQVIGTGWELAREKRALFERLGFREVQRSRRMKLFEMSFLPTLTAPAGVELRRADPHRDVDAMVRTINQAFADDWDFAPETPETIHHALTALDDRAERVFLAWHDGEPVGLCWTSTRRFAGGSSGEILGWIEVLGVIPGFRRRGLGRSLLLHGLLSLWDHGARSAGLTVDAGNAAALRLYHQLGFTEVSTDVHYLCEVGL